MNLAEYSIKNSTISWMVIILLIAGGIISFTDLGRLEDPAFTIKQAMIVTHYPGASAQEVEEEITLPLEEAVQQLPYLDNVTSTSSAGTSQITVEMKSIYRKKELAQIWDEMRRKVNAAAANLPPGAASPQVMDDFGDVFGVFYAISGEGYQYEDLDNYADFLRRELILLPGVGKVNIGGQLTEQIFLEVDRAKLNATGYSFNDLQHLLSSQNEVSDGGAIRVGSEYLRINAETRNNDQLSQVGGIVLGSSNGQLVYLRDIASISTGYADPPNHLYRFNGQPALSLGVSFSSGVNVVEIGQMITQRLQELETQRPIGMNVAPIYDQPAQVAESVDSFLIGLLQAVLIVVIVLLFTMGPAPGILMSVVLLLTILGTFIIMGIYGIELHRISLGALIIALGMLVDNAIVITEGVLIGIKRGKTRLQAAMDVVRHNQWPLLGATLIAITAFAPIGLSPDATGEFTGSLFWVLFISLLLSWVLAITLTPFLCHLMFKDNPQSDAAETDPYQGFVYQLYRHFLHFSLRFRYLTLGVMIGALVLALGSFGQVKQAFFPSSSLPMFTVEYWLPQGSDIRALSQQVEGIEQAVLALDGVEKITATIGRGAERFMLTYNQENSNPSYAQFIIKVDEFARIEATIAAMKTLFAEQHPFAFTKFQRFSVGPATKAKIEARITGPDPDVLRDIGLEIESLFHAEPDAINVRQDWRERAKVVKPQFDQAEGQRLGISKGDLDQAIAFNVEGQQAGVYRDGAKLLPIIARPPENERYPATALEDIQVYSPAKQAYVSIGQVADSIELGWEDALIKRRDRKRTLSVLADPVAGMTASQLFSQVSGKVAALDLPAGYSLSWGGEYEAQQDANQAVFAFLPLGVLIMIILTVLLFTSAKQTLVVWITVPFSMIGVTTGLLVTDSPFSFMALLAVLSLIGMQLKNGIVLVEEIKRLREEKQQDWFPAITDASISRLRPVAMAAITTIFGMLPLLSDVFFQPMAVTIMFGLGFATLLTLVLVPVLFALLYGVRTPAK